MQQLCCGVLILPESAAAGCAGSCILCIIPFCWPANHVLAGLEGLMPQRFYFVNLPAQTAQIVLSILYFTLGVGWRVSPGKK
jgi:hypothetical protein